MPEFGLPSSKDSGSKDSRERACRHCGSAEIRGRGRIIATSAGVIRTEHRCLACASQFCSFPTGVAGGASGGRRPVPCRDDYPFVASHPGDRSRRVPRRHTLPWGGVIKVEHRCEARGIAFFFVRTPLA